VELGKEMSEPGGLNHVVSDNTVLRLSTGAGDHRLALGRPRHQVSAQKEHSRRWSVECLDTRPSRLSVDDKLGGERPVEEQAVVDSAVEVAEEALESSEVGLSGIMHVETYLRNCIGDVWPGASEVLKCTGKTLVCSGVCHWVPSASNSLPFVSTGVEQGLQVVIPARSRISRVYAAGEEVAQWDEAQQ